MERPRSPVGRSGGRPSRLRTRSCSSCCRTPTTTSARSRSPRRRSRRIEARFVTGGRDVDPIVVLFGCRVTRSKDDPTGFATPFARKGASVVFHSSTDLLNSHASELARRLVKELATAGRRRRMVSDALTEFRRKAVEEGWVLAFAISAFGDADWRV
jgi:hypothetical protein